MLQETAAQVLVATNRSECLVNTIRQILGGPQLRSNRVDRGLQLPPAQRLRLVASFDEMFVSYFVSNQSY